MHLPNGIPVCVCVCLSASRAFVQQTTSHRFFPSLATSSKIKTYVLFDRKIHTFLNGYQGNEAFIMMQ